VAVLGTEYWARWTEVHPTGERPKHSYCLSAEVPGFQGFFSEFVFGSFFGWFCFVFVNGIPRMTLEVLIYELDPFSLGHI